MKIEWKWLGILIFAAAVGVQAAAPAPRVAHPGYYDPNLPDDPSEIPATAIEGEHYYADVPDTLDLVELADGAVNFLTRLISPRETDYCIYHLVWAAFNPAVFEIGHGSNQNQNAKWSESIKLMRAMTGSTMNLDQDSKLIGSLVRLTGPDGLFYAPVAGRPWAFIDPVTEATGKPYADIFGEGRQLRAYATWYQHDKNPMWKELANRKVDRLLQLAIRDGDKLWFKLARGYSPDYVETGEGEVAALGDVGQVFDSMTGDAAANMVCWMPQAAATWYKVSGYEPALELARGMAQYLYQDPVFYNRETGTFHNLGTFFTHCMNSMLSYALIAGDEDIAQWVKNGADQFFAYHDSQQVGLTNRLHLCDFGDMMQVACMLSRTGHGDYWETIDRWVRNGLTRRQRTREDVDRMNARPLTIAGDPNNTGSIRSLSYHIKGEIPMNKPLPPNLHQPDDANERCRGWLGGAGCCQGNGTRGIYYAWDSIMEVQDNRLKVNLLLNRTSPWADLDSYLPYEGKAVLKMKREREEVSVRVPAWADKKQVKVNVNGKSTKTEWDSGGYVKLDGVSAGDAITLEFPMKERVVTTEMKMGSGQKLGTLKVDYISLAELADDFAGREAGKLAAHGTGNNDGSRGLVWRWNETTGNHPTLDGKSAMVIPLTGNWNQYIDTTMMTPIVMGSQALTFMVIFEKTSGGETAMGFVRGASWGSGAQDLAQPLFKIRGTDVYISHYYESEETDEDTGIDIVAGKPQGLMIKVDGQGKIAWYYQDGGDKDAASAAWRNIGPKTSAKGNLDGFDMPLGAVGVNGLGKGTKESHITVKGNTVIGISENSMGYPIGEHQKYRADRVDTKNVRRFATEQRFIWY